MSIRRDRTISRFVYRRGSRWEVEGNEVLPLLSDSKIQDLYTSSRITRRLGFSYYLVYLEFKIQNSKSKAKLNIT